MAVAQQEGPYDLTEDDRQIMRQAGLTLDDNVIRWTFHCRLLEWNTWRPTSRKVDIDVQYLFENSQAVLFIINTKCPPSWSRRLLE